MLELLWLLLPVAAGSGWWIARREYLGRRPACAGGQNCFRGVNYLLSNRAEQAIEVFSQMAGVSGDTAEAQLTLGRLLRRRGEVDRAIHIHDELLSRASLSAGQRARAALELGEDYLRAGLFDRAEKLFLALERDPQHRVTALRRLVGIFEQEKDWRRAIECRESLEPASGQPQAVEVAHYHCELAEEALGRGEEAQARALLRKALERDPNCVRASMSLGSLALARHAHEAAIAHFQAVERQCRSCVPEVLDLLAQSYAALGRGDQWLEYLRGVHARSHAGTVTAALARLLAEREGPQAAVDFLRRDLETHPSLAGLRSLIELRLAGGEGTSHQELAAMQAISERMIGAAARYRCEQCGFVCRSLHWCCPSCQTWSSIRTVPDLVCHQAS